MYILHGFEHKKGLLTDGKTPWENFYLNFTTDEHDGNTVGQAIVQQKFKPEALIQAFKCNEATLYQKLQEHFGSVCDLKFGVVKGVPCVVGLTFDVIPFEEEKNPPNNKK